MSPSQAGTQFSGSEDTHDFEPAKESTSTKTTDRNSKRTDGRKKPKTSKRRTTRSLNDLQETNGKSTSKKRSNIDKNSVIKSKIREGLLEKDPESEQLVTELLDYFLASMGIVAETFVRDDLEDGSMIFEIEGEDAGLLIGRRGETLQALQLIIRLIVSRQLERDANVIIDVENYRKRRFDMLTQMARRAAGQVAKSGRSSSMDPMSPMERRIVHMSLSNHPHVRTESAGKGYDRHVVIISTR